ncbi:hypothetical protein ACE1N8_27350 [Streptomyces sp. DSM 116494]|uniref:hypothetical protein n=1 Tax=Streptomyces okerensis TaxID=3344655 RepID=UPI00389063ED
MHEDARDDWTPEGFAERRALWFDGIAHSLEVALQHFSPPLVELIPHDLGDRTLISATVLARLAAADVACAQLSQAAMDLQRVLGPHSGTLSKRMGLVEDVWRGIRALDHAALAELHDIRFLAWELPDLSLTLLQHWASLRAAELAGRFTRRGQAVRVETGWPAVHRELRERWACDSDLLWSGGFGPGPGPFEGWRALMDFARDADDRAAALFLTDQVTNSAVRGVLENMTARPFPYGDPDHLRVLWEQYALGHAVSSLAEASLSLADADSGGSPLPGGLRAALSRSAELGRTYQAFTVETVTSRLTAVERALIDRRGTPELLREDSYLEQWALTVTPGPGDPGAVPVESEHLYALLPPAQRPETQVPDWMGAEVAGLREAYGRRGRTGVLGTQSWWLYGLDGPEEVEAALDFQSAAGAEFKVDLGDPSTFLVGPARGQSYQDLLQMGFGYDDEDAHDLCRMLALARTGHARLGFLVHDWATGRTRMVRTTAVEIPGPLRQAMRACAMAELDAMTERDPGTLPTLLGSAGAAVAESEGEQHAWDLDSGLFARGDTLF